MTTSAHDLMRTVDCIFPGCPEEAGKGSEVCGSHRRWLAERHGPIETDDKRLRRMFDEDGDGEVCATADDAFRFLRDGTPPAPTDSPTEPVRTDSPTEPTRAGADANPPVTTATTSTEETPMALATCKIDGCDNPRLDARGVYGGLCAGHKNEKRQARAGAIVKPPPAAPAPEPEPEPEPEPQDTVVSDASPTTAPGISRIAELEAAVADLEEQLDAAKQELHAAATAYVDELRERYGIAA